MATTRVFPAVVVTPKEVDVAFGATVYCTTPIKFEGVLVPVDSVLVHDFHPVKI
jgi:hypothetical protein